LCKREKFNLLLNGEMSLRYSQERRTVGTEVAKPRQEEAILAKHGICNLHRSISVDQIQIQVWD